ncbi:nitronate monooxygenase [Actinobacillus succinogenes]|uniref:2-nitropropane dioxygenase NPD n=1 Tax=Actinobacillus succinogenes (strain ATCC 55618 / DSM 22257 / CCUG 43843 / 130Z) TaxID=339671 RepID=A6VPJ0_ACTSZ|nr:nitronate monooxygenase [Actinobacillus succinogenes]ABR74887.1 2-nitropropane dioxygenase NPD [Actinobacillus succinogenes 130Z]PHI40703.1 nitronate monooxygenase [Actinobacillus succinogenes]
MTAFNRITDILGIKFPLVQGPMSWMTDAKFVAAVSNAGGLGILGPNAGLQKAPKTTESLLDTFRTEIRKTKALTDKPFGAPVILSYDFSTIDLLVDLLIEERVPVALINGIDGYDYVPMMAKFKAAGIKTIFRAHTPTVENARYAEQIGADILVATGFDEGGTVPGQVIGTFSIVPQMADAVSIPVMAAGGIADVRGVRASFALGAEGVFVGSVLLPTLENRMHENVKQMIVDSTAQDLLLFRTQPAYYRSLPTKLAHKLVEMDEHGASRDELAQAQTGGYGMRQGMLLGDLENGYISVGNGITYIHEIRSVKEVVGELMQDFI